MENEYKELLSQAVEIYGIEDLYELLINEPAGNTYRLIIPKSPRADALMFFSEQTGGDLNEEHLRRQGITITCEYDDFANFLDDNADKCVFGDACTSYCVDLDTEEHPIPWLFYITFNDPKRSNDISNCDMQERYVKVLNYLAVKENRKLLDEMTPDNIPEVFHNLDNFYHMPVYEDYYERFDYKVKLPDTKDFNEIKEAIRNQLLKNNLI